MPSDCGATALFAASVMGVMGVMGVGWVGGACLLV
jgi:hypothetical protein